MNSTYLILINFRRKKVRTILTLGSFFIALFLFGLLSSIHNAFYQGIDLAGVDRLVIRNRVSLIMPLPVSYQQKLMQIDHVNLVTFASWFGGVYQSERNFFPQFAVDIDTYREMFPEFVIPDNQWKEFAGDREGCIVGEQLMERFGWKLGDRIPLRGTIFQGVWEFNIRGIYKGRRASDDQSQFWFHYKLLEERIDWIQGLVGWYYVRIDDPENSLTVSQAIDDRFENSPYETTTETERAFASGFVKQFGNIRLIILAVGSVVFFTLLLITGSNMAMSVRERLSEIGVLKTIGYKDLRIMIMVLAESLLMALLGGGPGLIMSKLYTLQGDPTGGMLPNFNLGSGDIGIGLFLTLCVGLVSGFIPAVQAMKLKIVDTLRRF